jgi:hypothetical protein
VCSQVWVVAVLWLLCQNLEPQQAFADCFDYFRQRCEVDLHLLDRLNGQEDFARWRAGHAFRGSGDVAVLFERTVPFRRFVFLATFRPLCCVRAGVSRAPLLTLALTRAAFLPAAV